MSNDHTTAFARPFMPITTFNAFSQLPVPHVPAAISHLLLPGLTLLTGPSHAGKTSLALQLMQSVATGNFAFGDDPRFQPSQGRVLYLALDHSELHMHTLQERLAASHPQALIPGNIHFTNTWQALTLDEGLQELEAWFAVQTDDSRLLVIDNLDALRPLYKGKDRDLLALLRRFAEKYRISVLLLHTCKPSSPLTAYADHHLHLKRLAVPDYCQLEVVGACLRSESYLLYSAPERIEFRLVSPDDALALNTLSAHKILSPERLEALHLFHERDCPLSPAEVAEALDYDPVNARQLLHTMLRARLLSSPSYGSYVVHPDLRAFLPSLLELMLLAEPEQPDSAPDQLQVSDETSENAIAHTSADSSEQSAPTPVEAITHTSQTSVHRRASTPFKHTKHRSRRHKR